MIIFQNPGLIDLAAVTTMGVSVKQDDTAIGYFGTGLKFAIATILREGGRVRLWRGPELYEFTAQNLTVRGQDFQQVHMNEQALGFTTQLGRNWQTWMAFRELASNCRDEQGRYGSDQMANPREGYTTIAVEGAGFAEAYADRHTVLLESKPVFENDDVEIHAGASEFVFYRGVRIHRDAHKTAHTYNIKRKIDLTEDRTAAYAFQVRGAIVSGLLACTDTDLLRDALDCGQNYLEHHLDFTSFAPPTDEFVALGNELAMGAANSPQANPSVVREARNRAVRAMEPGDSMSMNPVEVAMFERAKQMLTTAGFPVGDFPIVCADSLGPDIHGLAKDGKIFISRLPFAKGTREVAATLLEEYAHLASGQSDCTRGFQNWLFDQLLVGVENAAGEPF